MIADVGAHRAPTPTHRRPALGVADVVVVVHRQATASAAAATVRIERLVETVEELAHLDATVVLAVVGATPFDPAEIGAFVDESVPATVQIVASIADDPLSAATIAGRTGVSAKRLRRLPLMRDAFDLAGTLHELVGVAATRRRPAANRVSNRRDAASRPHHDPARFGSRRGSRRCDLGGDRPCRRPI